MKDEISIILILILSVIFIYIMSLHPHFFVYILFGLIAMPILLIIALVDEIKKKEVKANC